MHPTQGIARTSGRKQSALPMGEVRALPVQARAVISACCISISASVSFAQPTEDPFLVGIDILKNSPCLDVIVLVENFSNGRAVDQVELNAVNHYLNGFAAVFAPDEEGYLLVSRNAVFQRCFLEPTKSIVDITIELGRELNQ